MKTISQEQFQLIQSSLPESAKLITSLLGYKKAFELFSLFGGVSISFSLNRHQPRCSEINDMVKLLIGEESFNILRAHYSGERLYVPNCHNAILKIKRVNIIDEYYSRLQSGMSCIYAKIELCRSYSVSERMLYQWISDDYKRRKAQLVG